MRQIKFVVAPNALQDVLKTLQAETNDIRIEIYVFKKDGDLVVSVTEHDQIKKEPDSISIPPSAISPSIPPPWVDDQLTRYL